MMKQFFIPFATALAMSNAAFGYVPATPSVLYANLPSAATAGGEYIVTDYCGGLAKWRSNGTRWTPSGGVCIEAQGGTGWTNTGIGTSEVNLVSVPIAPMGVNDQLEISTLWTSGGTLSNNHTATVRFGTAACTPQSTCSTGTAFLAATISGTSATFSNTIIIRNVNSASAQVGFNQSSAASFGVTSGSVTTGTINSAGTPFINIDGTTNATSADSIKLEAYSIVHRFKD